MRNLFHKLRETKIYKQFSGMYNDVKLIYVSILLIIFGAIVSSTMLHGGGDIDVTLIKVPTQDGSWVVADLYKPETATIENQAPVVVVVPGFQRSKETQVNMGLELARRDVVTIVIDPYAQGDSSASSSTQAATYHGYGAFEIVEYLYNTDNINYIDKNRIGIAGHSAGGNAAIRAAEKYGKLTTDGVYDNNPVHSIFISGYVLSLSEGTTSAFRSNVGMDYALYDEGAFRNECAKTEILEGVDCPYADGDMRYAAESLNLVNSSLILNGEETIDEVELGKSYGSYRNGTYRVVYQANNIHAVQIYDEETTANIMNYFELVFEEDFDIAASNQVYNKKEIFQGLMLLGGFLFILGFGSAMLRTPYFSTIVHEIPAKAKQQSRNDKVVFWSVFLLGAAIAAALFIPMCGLARTLFPDAQGGVQTWFFPQRMTNSVMLWAVANGTIGLIIVFTMYLIRGKKHGQSLEGLKTSFAEMFKIVLLAIIVFYAFYSISGLVYYLFHVDYRFFFIAARPLTNLAILKSSLMYIPLFLIFYISNSIRVNLTMRFENWGPWKSYLIAGLANSLGLITIIAIQYGAYVITGRVFWFGLDNGADKNWLYVNILYGLIPMMFILPMYNKFFFEKTGRVYLGALITCLIFILMTLTNSVAYMPV